MMDTRGAGQGRSQLTHPGPAISVVVPTLNERENVTAVVQRLAAALTGEDWEVIFVDDDSPDGTAALVRELGRSDRRVRCLQRVARRGLSGQGFKLLLDILTASPELRLRGTAFARGLLSFYAVWNYAASAIFTWGGGRRG